MPESNCSRQSGYRRRSYKKKCENGLCVSCVRPAAGKSRHCADCKKKRSDGAKRRRAEYTSAGKCRMCGDEAQISNRSLRGKTRGNYCKHCWFKVLACYLLGSMKHWKVLVDKLDACGWRCPYSGEELILGVNLSFDHMDPICRFPEKKHDPDNLEPISWQINLMKRDLTKEEFINLVERIHLCCGSN